MMKNNNYVLIVSIILINALKFYGQTEITPAKTDSLFNQENFQKNHLFLIGETHFKKENNLIDLFVFENLYLKSHVRVLLMEMGYTSGFLLNKYLVNGDEKLLNSVDVFPDALDYFRKLRTFYLSLPANDKFVVKGIDKDNNTLGFLSAVSFLLPQREAPLEIKPIIDTFNNETKDLKQYNLYDKIVFKKYIYKFYEDLKDHENAYKEYLKSDYNDFQKIISSQMLSPYFYGSGYSNHDYLYWRELFLKENLMEVIKQYPGVNYFGQFGVAHVSLKPADKWAGFENWESFASMANNDNASPLKGKVCSSVIFYKRRMKKEKNIFINRKVIKQYSNNKGVEFIKYLPEKHYGVKNAYFQYIIISK